MVELAEQLTDSTGSLTVVLLGTETLLVTLFSSSCVVPEVRQPPAVVHEGLEAVLVRTSCSVTPRD